MMKNTFSSHKNSFRFRIAFYYLVASVSVIVLFSSVIYAVVSNIFVQETVSKTQMAIETSADSVAELLEHKKTLLNLYATDEMLLQFASGQSQVESAVLQKITAIKQSDLNILGVFVSLKNGTSLTSATTGFNDDPNRVNTQTPCLLDGRVGNYAHADPWTITLGVPLVDANHQTVGVLGMDLDYCLFSHTVEKLDLGNSGILFIEDNKGNLIFHSDKPYTDEQTNAQFLSKQFPIGYNDKTNTLVYRVAIANTQWTLFGVASPEGLHVLQRQLFDMVIMTALLLSFALIFITVTVSRKLTDPISRLVVGMEDIEQLAELSVQQGEISETAILTESYNHMIYKIKDLMQALEQKQIQLRHAEFDVLASQINPHFLYNTLDTIIWLSGFGDTKKIISLTKSLAAFFRLSLNGGKSVVSLQDEIEHVKQYLMIQKERYEDKFSYHFDIAEDTLEYSVPKIILQPIVENAIYHGIKPMEGNGYLYVSAKIMDNFLHITVSDNGVGLHAPRPVHTLKKTTGGVGLENIENRIRLFYGETAKLSIASDETGTHVQLHLPCIPFS